MNTATINACQERRQRLANQLAAAGGGIAILPTAPHYARNRDTEYAYRFDSYFYYLTGFNEPEAVYVLTVSEQETQSFLFCRSKNVEREIWDGFRYGPEAAAAHFGFDAAFPIEELAQKLPTLMGNHPTLWYALGHHADQDQQVLAALKHVREQGRSGISAPGKIHDLRSVLDEMRLIKDATEIATLQRAADISSGAHRRAMHFTRPGHWEYEVEAELLHEFRRHGSQSVAYNSIVAGGQNACVLHYIANNQQLKDGDLLLIDAGCELDGYAADITRTFPINGKFSGPQRDIYQLVLAAQEAALIAAHPGRGYNDTHDAAVKVLTQGLIDLGLLSGSLDAALEQGSYRHFYMHRTGHWLGLDVHDAGEYKQAGHWRALEAGMLITIEPGCYIRPRADIPEAFWHIGIRIEDDVLITAEGHRILTHATPKSIADIEAVMAEGRS